MQGPQDNPTFKYGPILRVKDMTDPGHPGKEKTFYVHRFIRRATDDVWSRRNRYDRPQPGAWRAPLRQH